MSDIIEVRLESGKFDSGDESPELHTEGDTFDVEAAILDEHPQLVPIDGVDEESDSDEFDAEVFVDRTPMDAVIEDIEAGEADDHLDAVAEAAEREGIKDAIDDRRE